MNTPDIAGTELGRFRLLRHIASGGMAEIYLATYDGPGGFLRKCVVKRLQPAQMQNAQAQAMFFTEARVMASLQHPNIVQVIDFSQHNHEYVLAMEYIDGSSLLQLSSAARKRGLPLGVPIAVAVGIAIARALSYAHSARGADGALLNLVHRDVTPGNILISRSGEVKLADFGVAKVSNAAHETEVGMIKGKFAYMSPEQIAAEPLDGRSDIFSLGIILWELVTRMRLFKRADVSQELLAIAQAQVRPPTEIDPSIPHDFERIVMRCLAKSPAARYQSAADLCADLVEYRDNWELQKADELLRDMMTIAFKDAEEDPVLRPNESTSGGAPVRSLEAFTSRVVPPPAKDRSLLVAGAVGLCLITTFWIWLLLLR